MRPFSPSGTPNGILVVSRDDWPGRAVIFPRALAGEVMCRKEYQQPGVYILVSSKRMYIGEDDPVTERFELDAPSYAALRGQLCEAGGIAQTPEGLLLTKDQFFSSVAAAAVALGAVSHAEWWKGNQDKSLGDYIREAKAKV